MTAGVFALAAMSMVVVACGDDDDEAASTDTTEAATEDDGGSGEGADFCTAYQEMLAGDPAPDEIREVAAIAPGEGKEALEAIADGFESDPEGYFETPEFGENFSKVGDAAAGECADETIEVTAVEYEFQGMPDEISPGVVAVDLANDGKELHEIVVFRKNDDTTESWDELFAMEDESAVEELVTQKGAAFAAPGSSAAGLISLEEEGDYIAVCFIPVGSTPDAEGEPEGPPHFTQGMKVEFSVA